ncbi:hypothetical protein MD484_g5998, partial [Candolleomyces efflorescens]
MSILNEFPTELWYELIQLLEPRHLLALSNTNRHLNSLLSTKDAWAIVLKRVCKERMLFAPSYPIDDMNLPQIKHAALGPYRWLKAVERQQRLPHTKTGGTLVPPILKPIRRSVFEFTAQWRYLRKIFLVPGGRFLVLDNDAVLQIMDLGAPGSPLLNPPRLVHEVDLDWEDSQSHSITVQETTGGGLRVVVMLVTSTDLEARVYDFFLPDIKAYSKQVGRLSLALNSLEQYDSQGEPLLDEERVLLPFCCNHSQLILIWDFVKAVYALQARAQLSAGEQATGKV